jgi:predicted transcriptional regulator
MKNKDKLVGSGLQIQRNPNKEAKEYVEKKLMELDPNAKLKEACKIVEKHCRSIGKDCEVIFLDDSVQLGCLSWSGCGCYDDLYEAIIESKENQQ